MVSSFIQRDDAAATRLAVVAHIALKLAPLFEGRAIGDELAEWLAPLSSQAIARALRQDPAACADALATALLREAGASAPCAAVFDAVALEYPRLSDPARSRLVEFTLAVRSISRESDGVVTDLALIRAGFGSNEAARLLPQAMHLLAVMHDEAPSLGDHKGSSATRLREAGTRAAQRAAYAEQAA